MESQRREASNEGSESGAESARTWGTERSPVDRLRRATRVAAAARVTEVVPHALSALSGARSHVGVEQEGARRRRLAQRKIAATESRSFFARRTRRDLCVHASAHTGAVDGHDAGGGKRGGCSADLTVERASGHSCSGSRLVRFRLARVHRSTTRAHTSDGIISALQATDCVVWVGHRVESIRRVS